MDFGLFSPQNLQIAKDKLGKTDDCWKPCHDQRLIKQAEVVGSILASVPLSFECLTSYLLYLVHVRLACFHHPGWNLVCLERLQRATVLVLGRMEQLYKVCPPRFTGVSEHSKLIDSCSIVCCRQIFDVIFRVIRHAVVTSDLLLKLPLLEFTSNRYPWHPKWDANLGRTTVSRTSQLLKWPGFSQRSTECQHCMIQHLYSSLDFVGFDFRAELID